MTGTLPSIPNLGAARHFNYISQLRETAALDVLEEDEPLIEGTGKILIMDDEGEIRDILGKMLEHLGYEVTYTSEGTEAVAAYHHALQTRCAFLSCHH